MNQQPIAEALLQHEDWLRRLARRLVGDAAMAEDAVQEAWVAALTQPPQNVEPSKIKAWLGGVVRNMAFGQMRAASTRRAREREAFSLAEDDEDLDVKKQELIELVLESLSSLEGPERELVQQRYLEDVPPRRIAEELGVTSAIVRKRLSRAVHKLREELDRRFGVDRRAWVALLYRIAGPAQGSLKAAAAIAALLVSLAVWTLVDSDVNDLAMPSAPTEEVAALEAIVPPNDVGVVETRQPATTPAPLEEAKPNEPDDSEGTWLEGEIVLPPTTPRGELPTVRLVEHRTAEALLPPSWTDMPARGRWILDGPWTELASTEARLDPEGRLRFRIRIPDDRERVHVTLDGRFLYLPGTEDLDIVHGQTNTVDLHPLLGALVRVRFERADGLPYEVADGVDPDARWLAAPDVRYIEHKIPSFSRSRLRSGGLPSDGSFEIRALPAGAEYWLGVRSNIHGLRARELPVLRPGDTHELRFLVDTAPRIRGVVVDEDGLPVAGATVGLQGGSPGYLFPPAPSLMELTTTTDGSGAYEFPRQPVDMPWGERVPDKENAESAVLHAKKPGYVQSFIAAMPGTDETTLVLTRGAQCSGRILWPDGTPAIGAEVHVMVDRSDDPLWVLARTADGLSDERGHFSVTGLASGTWAIRVEAQRPVEGRGESGWAYLRGLASDAPEPTIELQPTSRIVGRVLLSDGRPAPAFTIHADPLPDLPKEGVTERKDLVAINHGGPLGSRRRAPDRISWRDPGGWFELEGLMYDTWRLYIQAPGHSLSQPFIVRTDDPGELEVQLRPSRELNGLVLDPEGRPVPYAFVEIAGGEALYATANNDHTPEMTRVHANGEGRFRSLDAFGGFLTVRARRPGFGPSLPVSIQPAPGWPGPFTEPLEPIEPIIELRPRAGLKIRVVNADGSAPSDMSLTLFSYDRTEVRQASTNKSGLASFKDLAPTVYALQVVRVDLISGRGVMDPGYEDRVSKDVDLTVDHDQEITIVMP